MRMKNIYYNNKNIVFLTITNVTNLTFDKQFKNEIIIVK